MLVQLKAGVAESVVNDVTGRLRMSGLAVHRTDHEGRVRLAAMGEILSAPQRARLDDCF